MANFDFGQTSKILQEPTKTVMHVKKIIIKAKIKVYSHVSVHHKFFSKYGFRGHPFDRQFSVCA